MQITFPQNKNCNIFCIFCRYFKPKLHYMDLLWICCTACSTTNPQQIHNKSKAYNKLYNKSTTNRSPTTNPQQIHNKLYNLLVFVDLLWICCGFVVQLVVRQIHTNPCSGVWVLQSSSEICKFVVMLLYMYQYSSQKYTACII